MHFKIFPKFPRRANREKRPTKQNPRATSSWSRGVKSRFETKLMVSAVIAGLDPAIHHPSKRFFSMDARVKPAHDAWSAAELFRLQL
jgi:hypothetical protein